MDTLDFEADGKAVNIELEMSFHNPAELEEYEVTRNFRTLENVRN